MKRFLLTLVIAVGVSAPAQATVRSVAPPGNSSVNQYIESIPTDRGNQPTNSVHSKGGGSSHAGGVAGGGGGPSAGGGSSAGASSGSSGPVSQSTQRALSAQGPDGHAAASLAASTAPAVARHRHIQPATAASIPVAPKRPVDGSSAIGSLAAALTGSGSTGGLGTLLPAILVVALLGSGAMALLRRRSDA
jgi:hypothetical protein